MSKLNKSKQTGPEQAVATVPMEQSEHSVFRGKDSEGRELSPLNIVGQTRRDSGPTVMTQVFINCNVGRADRRAMEAMPIHEIPLQRMNQRRVGGDVEPIASWAPGISQTRKMTKNQLADELVRLRGNQDPVKGPVQPGKYVINGHNGELVDLFSECYGGVNGQPHTLFEKMRLASAKWKDIVAAAEDRGTKITVDELEELIATCEPVQAQDGLDELEGIDLEPEAPRAPRPAPVAPGGLMDPLLIEYLTVEHDAPSRASLRPWPRPAAPN
jgi:hypothetical protein